MKKEPRAHSAVRAFLFLTVFAGAVFSAVPQVHATVILGTISSGMSLKPGDSVYSPDGAFYLTMQKGGNLVLYRKSDGAQLFTSKTNQSPGAIAVMQADGNLIISYKNKTIWATHTNGHAGAHGVVQVDGTFVIYSGHLALWSSGYGGLIKQPVSYAALDAYAASRSGDVGFAVFSATGPLHEYHSHVLIRSASIIKVGILAALIDKAARAHRGLTAAEQNLAGNMIRISDNDSASALWNEVGGTNVISFLRSIGMSSTKSDPTDPGAWGYTLTTAHDFGVLAAALFNRKIATPALCNYELSLMTQIASYEAWGIKPPLPQGTWVAFKNGWYPENYNVWRVNSVGIVMSAGLNPYMLAVLTRYNVNLGENYGINTIQHLSFLAYQAQANAAQQ